MAGYPPGQRAQDGERRGTVVAWLVIALVMVAMIAKGLLSFAIIGDRPRAWSYRSAPLVPAETYSSTAPAPTSAAVPEQVQLPPAVVGKKAER